jgi:hypothetical protein
MTQIANSLQVLEKMAGTTGLEPAASAVTGQRSNQLNYVPTLVSIGLAGNPYVARTNSRSSCPCSVNRIVTDSASDRGRSYWYWYRNPSAFVVLANRAVRIAS